MYLQNLDEVLEIVLLDGSLHDVLHLLSNELLVGSLSVASGLDLLGGLLGESNAEESHDVSIGGLGLNESLNG